MRKKEQPPLTMEQKLDIFRRDEQGESRKNIALFYDRSIDTVNSLCAAMMGEIINRYRQNKTNNKTT